MVFKINFKYNSICEKQSSLKWERFVSIDVEDIDDYVPHVGTIGVSYSSGVSSKLAIDLLSALYEDLQLQLFTSKRGNSFEDKVFSSVGQSHAILIDIDREVICPTLALFDSAIFAFNYQNF